MYLFFYLLIIVGGLFCLIILKTKLSLDLDVLFARKVLRKNANRKNIRKGYVYETVYELMVVAIGIYLIYWMKVPAKNLEIPGILILVIGLLYFAIKYSF